MSGQHERYADKKKKGWKNKVGGSPAVPFGMGDEMVGFLVATGIIHQDHAGDGETAKNV